MYADDVVFYVPGRTLAEAEFKLQQDATRVYNWFSKSGLCINTAKPKIMLFHQPRTHNQMISIYMGTNKLSVCDSYEYLGVILDSKLNLNKMVNQTISSSSNRLFMYGNLRKKMSLSVATLVYMYNHYGHRPLGNFGRCYGRNSMGLVG